MTVKETSSEESKRFRSAIFTLEKNNLVGKVGWFGKYPSFLTSKGSEPIAVAKVALQNELGNSAKGIPPRPFITPAIQGNRNKWKNTMSKGCLRILKGEAQVENILELVCLQAVGDIKRKINAVTSPALKRATILARLRRRGLKPVVLNNATGTLGKDKNKARAKTGKSLNFIDKPLVDTGILFQTLIGKVESLGGES